MTTDDERYGLIQRILEKRSAETYFVRCAAEREKKSRAKRAALHQRACTMEGACDTARAIECERNTSWSEKEERVKALFLHLITTGQWGVP